MKFQASRACFDWLTGGSYIGSSLLASDTLFAEGFPLNSRDLILFDENRTLDFDENEFELVDQRSEVAILDWPLRKYWIDAVLASLADDENDEDEESARRAAADLEEEVAALRA